MADPAATEAPPAAEAGAQGPGLLDRLRQLGRQSDVMLALGVFGILVVLLIPLPTWLLDILLALSITFSVLILLVSLFIQRPLDFSSFPTVLLIATLMRLALNLATTRLILSHGHEGPAAAGAVIQAFGGLLMGGSFIIGVIVFAILVIVNFVVITKGSGRIAEVSARFSLDAMPGKQMAIDADLSAGLIDEATARKRRQELEDESQFYGSMDGAAKFVRGDAVAGLLITAINIVAGLIIGTTMHGLTFAQAAQYYTLLTVGDGLVSQVPALITSIASGLLVTKSGVRGSADKALIGQLGGYPKALVLCSFLTGALALIPGLPFLPFAILAAGSGYAGYLMFEQEKKNAEEAAVRKKIEETPPPPPEEPIQASLHIDLIRLELGYGLLPLINADKGQKLTDQIKALRRQLAADQGFVMPSVRIQDNMQLPSTEYCIRVKEIAAGRGDLRPGQLLVMDPRGEAIPMAGEPTKEPTFGLPAMWIDESLREEAMFKGLTVVDPQTVITTHLTEIVKDHMADLLSHAETQKLLDDLGKEHKKLVEELIPSQITVGGLQRVLGNLLAERVSIRDLPAILEAVSESAGHTRNITAITEHVRARLARQLCEQHSADGQFIPLVTLGPEWEQAFAESIVGQGDERQLSMPPSRLQDFIQSVRTVFERHALMGESPVLLTSPLARPFVRSIIDRFRPATVVMSQNEIHPRARIKTVGTI
ncbi:MAG: flagellar biosynthesis protein FlhA [Azospirillum sp.]|nr:flagellar biosynthesis protein FlhA [Azospirillum sp.]